MPALAMGAALPVGGGVCVLGSRLRGVACWPLSGRSLALAAFARLAAGAARAMATVALRLAARCAMTLAGLTWLAGRLGRGLLLAEFFRNLLGARLAKAHLDRAAVLEAERAVNRRVPLDALERTQHLTVQGVNAGRHRHDVRLGLGKGRRQLDLQVQRGGRCQRHHALAQRLADLVALFAGQRRGCRRGRRRRGIRSGSGC